MLKRSDGSAVAMVAGGDLAQGMDMYDVNDESVMNIFSILPAEVGGTVPLSKHGMVSVNGDKELLIVGGVTSRFISDIWKYTLATNIIVKIGNLKTVRAEMGIVPFKMYDCPWLFP